MKIRYKKVIAFERFERYSARVEYGHIILLIDIDHTKGSKEEYPYRLLIDGTYDGDFKTLKSAKEYAQSKVNQITEG